jgi:hypothetical protein
MSTTSWRQAYTLFSMFRVTFRSVSRLVLATVCSVLYFSSSKLRELFEWTLSFWNPHRKKPDGVRSGDRGIQRPRPTMRLPKNSCREAVVFTVWVVAPSCWNQKSAERLTCQHCPTPNMFLVANTSCIPKCCYQSVCCCFIRYFRVRIRIAKCFTNSSKRFRCKIVFEYTMFVPP